MSCSFSFYVSVSYPEVYSRLFFFFFQVLDVKSSWRKAVEEDEAEKKRQTKLCESLTGLSPSPPSLGVSCNLSPTDTSHSSPLASQQGASHKTSQLWTTSNTELLDSLSATVSSGVHFSLDHETLPEMPSCDSLLSLDDEAFDVQCGDEEELLIPSLKMDGTNSTLATRHQFQQSCSNGSFTEKLRVPECLLTNDTALDVDSNWLVPPAKTVDSNQAFSLDLDSLDTPLPPKMQEYSLPKLITFSPIDDDMKC